MVGKLLIIIGIISGVILTVIFNTTTPATAGAFGILAVFVFTYLLTVSMMTYLLHGISHAVAFASRTLASSRPVEVLSMHRSYYYATIVALAPVIIISMQSVGGISVYELCLVLLLVLLGCIYVTKRSS